jgi:beta-galactosamide-alpha-2,3-sialyltransferase
MDRNARGGVLVKTILICYTPLHVLIAERLVDEGYIEEFYFLYICFNRSSRHEYYFERLAGRAQCGAEFLCLPHNACDLLSIIKWKFRMRRLVVDYLITGNIKHFHTRFVAYLFNVHRFKTFDDGSGNIVSGGYFSKMREVWIGRLIFSILSPRLLYRSLIEKIEWHYTIYREKNVFGGYAANIKKLELVGNMPDLLLNDGELATVYFGHALVEDKLRTPAEAEKLDKAIFDLYQVNFLLPHPRSRSKSEFAPLQDLAVSEPYVAEEFVLRILKKYARVRVVGINSTALLNIPTADRIEAVNVDAVGLFSPGELKDAMRARKVTQISEAELYAFDKKEVI